MIKKIFIVIAFLLIGVFIYEAFSSTFSTKEIYEAVPEETKAEETLMDTTQRTSKSYRLEDNLSVPSERVFENN